MFQERNNHELKNNKTAALAKNEDQARVLSLKSFCYRKEISLINLEIGGDSFKKENSNNYEPPTRTSTRIDTLANGVLRKLSTKGPKSYLYLKLGNVNQNK